MDGRLSTNLLGNRDGKVLYKSENFKTKEESKLGALDCILKPHLYPELYPDAYQKSESAITRPVEITKKVGTT